MGGSLMLSVVTIFFASGIPIRASALPEDALSALLGKNLEDQGTPTEECPPGWLDSAYGCYLFHFAQTGTWADANEQCELLGGFLAEPKREEEAAILTSLAFVEQSFLGDRAWWIGLSDMGHEGRWFWQHSLEDLEYNDWAPGSPRGTETNQDCATMDPLTGFKWTDIDCLQTNASPICQKGSVEYSTPPSTSTTATTTTEPTEPTDPTDPGTEPGTDPGTDPGTEPTDPTDPDYVELRGGDGASSGNVFAVNRNFFFGPVCDDYWDDRDASVVCRQLGFNTGTAAYHFGNVPEVMAMDDVQCTGSEETLQQCTYRTYDNCAGSEGAGVECH